MLESVRRALLEDYGIYSAQTGVQLFSAMPRSGLAEAEAAIAPWLALTDSVERARIRERKKKGPSVKGSDTGP
jgi:hypothetical protein